MDTEYIGTKGTHLGIVENPNRSISSIAQSGLQINNATSFTYQTQGANSHYKAAQVRVTRRLSRCISANSLYTFSKGIDDASTFSGTGGTVVQFLDNRGLERGLSTFDMRHNLNAAFQLSSPVGVRGLLRNGLEEQNSAELEHERHFQRHHRHSVDCVRFRQPGQYGRPGGRRQSAGRGDGPADPAAGDPYFNALAFTTPVAGQFGDAGRDTIPGLFRITLNSSLNRSFRFGETRRTLTFSINATNVLNHVTITSIGTTVNSANYGLPTAASATRGISLNSRFSF